MISHCVSHFFDCTKVLYWSVPIYTDKEGNRVLIGICVANIVLYLLTFLFYRRLNQRREKIWGSMTPKVRVCRLSVDTFTFICIYFFEPESGRVSGSYERCREPEVGFPFCILNSGFFRAMLQLTVVRTARTTCTEKPTKKARSGLGSALPLW